MTWLGTTRPVGPKFHVACQIASNGLYRKKAVLIRQNTRTSGTQARHTALSQFTPPVYWLALQPPITEVKQHLAMLVLGWVTAWEYVVFINV